MMDLSKADTGEELYPTVTASFESRCGICDEIVNIGDEIIMVEGEWCHDTCVKEYDLYEREKK